MLVADAVPVWLAVPDSLGVPVVLSDAVTVPDGVELAEGVPDSLPLCEKLGEPEELRVAVPDGLGVAAHESLRASRSIDPNDEP